MSRDLYLAFFLNASSQILDNSLSVILNFFENLQRFLQLQVHHWCQHQWWSTFLEIYIDRGICRPIVHSTMPAVKFAACGNDTSAVNSGPNIRLSLVTDTGGAPEAANVENIGKIDCTRSATRKIRGLGGRLL